MIVLFKDYLHGSKESMWSKLEDLEKEHDFQLSDQVKHDLSYTFYEIEFECELDTETGQITILSAKLD